MNYYETFGPRGYPSILYGEKERVRVACSTKDKKEGTGGRMVKFMVKFTSHNCKMSQESMDKIPYRLFMTPPWSPDLNSIENIFHHVGVCLRKDVIMKNIK